MLQEIITQLFSNDIFIGLFTGVTSVPLIAGICWSYGRYKTRKSRAFWKPLLKQKLSVVLTEYDTFGDDLSSKTAKTAGGGFLISRGNAMALSTLLEYIPIEVSKRSNISVIGDKSGNQNSDHLIIIGSWANNLFAKSIFENLIEKYDIPYDVIWDENTGAIGFKSLADDRVFMPIVKEGQGSDYAVIIRAKYRSHPDRYVVMLAGAHMYGAQAAAMAVTNHEMLKHVKKTSHGSSDLLFLIRTSVINNSPCDPELEIGNQVFIHDLLSSNPNPNN